MPKLKKKKQQKLIKKKLIEKKLIEKKLIKKKLVQKTKKPKKVEKIKKVEKVVKVKNPKARLVIIEPVIASEKIISRPRGRPKGRKNKTETGGMEKKVSNVYFTQVTEDAIVAYNAAEDSRVKDRIYNESIRDAFIKIAENVYNTFKFSYADVSPLEIQKQAISHMVANISKYEKGRGKAFSYFSIVAKNWFILNNNTTYLRFKKHVEICEQAGEAGEFVIEPEHEKQENETREFIKLMVEYWDKNVGKFFNKDRDLKIANAVIEIFRNADRIDVFNKKALYLYIREIADCQTQHITKVINKLQEPQCRIRDEYYNTGKITN
jgi:hypothetical protein